MAGYCKISPNRGKLLFDNLKERFDYSTAWKLWALSTLSSFKKGKNFKLDAEGFPTIESMLADSDVQKIVGDSKEMDAISKGFKPLYDTRNNYTSLVLDANNFNTNPKNNKYIAIVEKDSSTNNLKVNIYYRTDSNKKIAKEQFATELLNRRIVDTLSSIGVTIEDVTEAEMLAGRVGVTDFTKAKNLAGDCASMIRVSNNYEGAKALGEEFSHLTIGVFRESPIIQRALKLLQKEELLKAILGDEYGDTMSFQDNNIELVAEEALGKLLRENLLAKVSNNPKSIDYIMDRVYNYIRNKFKPLEAEALEDALIEANNYMGEFAKKILESQINLDKQKIAASERNAQFNALSDRIKTNIEILKKAKNTEIKRLKITQNASKDQKDEINGRITDLNKALNDSNYDTRIGIYNYAQQAIKDLQRVQDIFDRKTFTGTPSFASLRLARSYIQSYSMFINMMRSAIIDAKNDEEVPEYMTDLELEDGTIIEMAAVIRELGDMSDNIVVEYSKYAEGMIIEFFRPFFGDSRVYTTGKNKGKRVTIEEVVRESSQDIGFLDLFLDTMADSSDVFVQLFDQVAKKANDEARHSTIDKSKDITRLRLIAEENGITDFGWIYERDSTGKKTGNYISKYNIGEFQKQKRAFMDSLVKRYGDNPKGEAARAMWKELREWNSENAQIDNPDMPKEISRWENEVFNNLTDAQKDVYDGIMQIKWDADNIYPDTKTSPYKAIQRRKSSGNRIVESLSNIEAFFKNIKEEFSNSLLSKEDDDQLYGDQGTNKSLTNFDGTEFMTLPVLYTKRLSNPEELSEDIFSDLLVYVHASNTYEQMSKIVDPLEVARSYAAENRKTQQTRGGNPVKEIINMAGQKVVNKIYKRDSNSQSKIDSWMESHLYLRHTKREVTSLMGKEINLGKWGDAFLKLSSMGQLGFNYAANTANILTGIAMINVEAFAQENFTKKQLASADSAYMANMPAFLSELGSRNKTNFISLFDELFNIKGEYSRNIKRNQMKNLLQKLFGETIAYLGQEGGDHWLYNRVAMAYVKNIQVFVPKEKKQIKKVKGLKDAEKIVDSILENSSHMELTEDEQHYRHDSLGKLFARVTQVITAHNDFDTFNEKWKVPSTNIGTGIDILIRDFFGGVLVKDDKGVWHHDSLGDDLENIYPNVKLDDMNAFFEQLSSLRDEFEKKGLHVIPNGVVARGKLKINKDGKIANLDVAGTLDLLAYDNNGDFYIYDIKTHRRKNIQNSTKHKWSMQVSLYKRFLEEEYGIHVKELNVIPVKVSYDTPDGEKSGVEFGHAKYSVVEDTNQLLQNGKPFKEAKPILEPMIPMTVVNKIPIEYDNLGYNKTLAKEEVDDSYEKMSLFEALKIIDVFSDREDIKKMIIPEGTLAEDGTPIDSGKISQEIRELCIHLFGAYDDENSNVANRYVAGRALQQMRKWIKPQFNYRFQKAQISTITGKTREGYYRTYGKYVLAKFLSNVANEALRGSVQIPARWEELSEEEKANVKRARTEILQFFLVYILATWTPWPDDKKRPWILKAAEYCAQREKHELGMLVPSLIQVQEMLKTVKDPIAAASSAVRLANLVGSLITPAHWVDEKQSGPYKGHSTLYANTARAPLPFISWYRQIDKFTGELDTSIQYYARPSW